MKKTKIICTMGPNTDDEEMMRKLVKAGMDVARFNFSHGDHEEQDAQPGRHGEYYQQGNGGNVGKN